MNALDFLIVAMLACFGFTLFAYAALDLVSTIVIRFAASRLGQHQGQVRIHTEVE